MTKIFVDFDGTITRRDVGDALFETFGGSRCLDAVEQYRNEKLSAVECFRLECDACGDVELSRYHAFLDAQEIDASFKPFIEFCRGNAIDHYILSDGMDAYIRYILDRHGLGDVPFFANKLTLVQTANASTVRFVPAFPYTDEVCQRCACCKRNHMLSLSGDDDVIVYVGEGYSDRCPSRYADIVFAKDDLRNYCRQENISFFEYESFADVTDRLRSLMNHGKAGDKIALRKRRQAELARREILLGG
jgi:2-hydroxy-3-keto-5-methylthiopentenyl-1-phosphate phosphatase